MLNTPPHEKRAGPEVSFRSFMVPLPPLRDGGRALPIPSFRQTCLPLILDAPDCICSPGRLLLGGGRTYASYTMRKPSGRFPSGGRLVICFMDGRSGTLGLGGIRAAAVALAEHVAQAGVAHFGDHVRDEVRGHRHDHRHRRSDRRHRRAHEPRRADGVRRHPLYRLGSAGRAHPLHGRRRHRVWPLAHRSQGARHDLCRPGRWQQARRAYR